MCQTKIVMELGNQQSIVAENASILEVSPEGISISTLFEPPKFFKDVEIRKIDFMDGKVYLMEKVKK